jgi:hypothetical protein
MVNTVGSGVADVHYQKRHLAAFPRHPDYAAEKYRRQRCGCIQRIEIPQKKSPKALKG